MQPSELKDFLDQKAAQYNSPQFITSDPIQIPHAFTKKEDIEIAGFLIAVIAWGQRKTIIANGEKLMDIMGHSPYEFVLEHSAKERATLPRFVHRTFQPLDLVYFLKALQHLYTNGQSLETAFLQGSNTWDRIEAFKSTFFSLQPMPRTLKHLPSPSSGSSAKRINMYLRWMVRNDTNGVDFGIWKQHKPSELLLPLDVHTGNMARKLGILSRKQNDRKSVDLIMNTLRTFDPEDPVKYDFALFGLGAFDDL